MSFIVRIARIHDRVCNLCESVSRSFPIVYTTYFFSEYLIEPYCCLISSSSSSEIPVSIDRESRIVWESSYSVLESSNTKLFFIVCSLYSKVKSLLWIAWIFTLHIISLLFLFLLIPSHLCLSKNEIRIVFSYPFILLYLSKVFLCILSDRVSLCKLVCIIEPPSIEVELVVHICERFSHLLHLHCFCCHIIEVSGVSLCCTFNVYFTCWSDCIECTCLYFTSFIRVFIAYLTIL